MHSSIESSTTTELSEMRQWSGITELTPYHPMRGRLELNCGCSLRAGVDSQLNRSGQTACMEDMLILNSLYAYTRTRLTFLTVKLLLDAFSASCKHKKEHIQCGTKNILFTADIYLHFSLFSSHLTCLIHYFILNMLFTYTVV